jgi:hypothetical protein
MKPLALLSMIYLRIVLSYRGKGSGFILFSTSLFPYRYGAEVSVAGMISLVLEVIIIKALGAVTEVYKATSLAQGCGWSKWGGVPNTLTSRSWFGVALNKIEVNCKMNPLQNFVYHINILYVYPLNLPSPPWSSS